MTDFATRPDQEAIKAADIAFWEQRNKAEIFPRLLPMHAAIDAYLAKMPRAWALIEQPGDTPSAGDLFDSERDARQDLECYPHGRVVPIALVPVKDDAQ